MHSPTYAQLHDVKRVFRYISGTLHVRLHFKPSSLSLLSFSDSDWADNQSDTQSTTRFIVYFGKETNFNVQEFY